MNNETKLQPATCPLKRHIRNRVPNSENINNEGYSYAQGEKYFAKFAN